MPCAESDEELMSRSSLLRTSVGVSDDPFARDMGVPLSTLRHFDSKVASMVKIRPLIPWERRLAKTEISEFQEVTFRGRFENRD